MFQCAIDLLVDFISLIPGIVCILLTFSIIRELLWGSK